jgi:protein O-mannosyl-transferase
VTTRSLDRLVGVLLGLIVIGVFLPGLHGEFLDWDDPKNFLENPHYRGLGPAQLHWMFTAFHHGHYMPMTWLTLGWDYVLWGMNPFGYHLTSLLLHAANAILVYLLAIQLMSAVNRGPQGLTPSLRIGAAFAALLFALHPLRVESVAWVTERRDVLCGFFYLLAILAYLRWCDAQFSGAEEGRGWYGASLAAFSAALLSKSMAVSLPLVLLVLDVYPLRRLTLDRGLMREGEQRRMLKEKIPFLALAAAAAVVAFIAIRHLENLVLMSGLGVVERVSIASFAIVFYLWKMMVPLHLSALYELPDSIHWQAPSFLLSGLLVVTITGMTLGLRRRWPILAAVWVTYVLMLLPVSGIAQNGPQIAADRYTYLPMIGWAFLAGGCLWTVLASTPRWATRRVWAPTMAVVVAALIALAVLTRQQVMTWHDSAVLWTHALAVQQSSVAHSNFGRVLALQGHFDEAAKHFREAIRIKPAYAMAHNNLGLALASQGQLSEATQHYQEAIRLKPRYADPHYNLGLTLASQGKLAEAVGQYRQALQFRPDYGAAHQSLAIALSGLGQWPEALDHSRDAVRINPDSPEAHNSLGIALARGGDLPNATRHFREAVRLRSDDSRAHNNLGISLAEQGQMPEATLHFREALRLDPAFREAQVNLQRATSLQDSPLK